MEPTCHYCGTCTKFRCHDMAEAEDCTDYKRNKQLRDTIDQKTEQFAREKAAAKDMQLSMTDYSMETPVTVESHYDGTPEFIAIRQEDVVLVSCDEAERLIKMLRKVIDHVKNP